MSVFLVVFLLPVLCFAEAWNVEQVSLDEKFNLAVDTGAAFSASENLGTGIYVKGVASYDLMDYLAIGVEVGYTNYDAKAFGQDIGRIGVFTLLADVILKYPVQVEHIVMVPYMSNGFGIMSTTLKESGDWESSGGSFDKDVDFAYRFALGLDVYVMETMSVYLETSYLWSSADWTATSGGGDQTNIIANAYYLGGGLRLRF